MSSEDSASPVARTPVRDGEHEASETGLHCERQGQPQVDMVDMDVPMPPGWKLLPVDDSYNTPLVRFCRYRGTVFNTFQVRSGCVEHWKRFSARASDVIVASFPKSGTTWLQEIIWKIVHGQTELITGRAAIMECRFPLLELPTSSAMPMLSIHEMKEPRLMKTHLPYHLLSGDVAASGARVLYISRDVRDVCVSYYHFCRMVNHFRYRGTFRQFRELFTRDDVFYGPCREHTQSYLKHSDTVFCLTYEELHDNRDEVIKRIATFLGTTVTEEVAERIARDTSFSTMKEDRNVNFRHWEENGMVTRGQEGTFMRKGQIGDWKNYFTEEESHAFMKWRNASV